VPELNLRTILIYPTVGQSSFLWLGDSFPDAPEPRRSEVRFANLRYAGNEPARLLHVIAVTGEILAFPLLYYVREEILQSANSLDPDDNSACIQGDSRNMKDFENGAWKK